MHVLRLVLLGIAIGVAAILGWRFVGNPFETKPGLGPVAMRTPDGGSTPPRRVEISAADARTRIETAISSASEYGAFTSAMRSAFPDVYERAMDVAARATHDNGRIETPDYYFASILRTLRQSHGVLAARSSDAALERVFALQANVLDALAQADPKLCADFMFGKATPAFYIFAEGQRGLIAAMAQANLDAIMDGRKENIERPAPQDSDFSSIESQMTKKGLGQMEIEAILDGKTPEPPLADAVMCRAGGIFFETLRDLPGETKFKIYATFIKLLARS